MIRVAIIEDEKYTREMLSALLANNPGHTCISISETAEDAIRNILADPPEVVLVDIYLGGGISGVDCVRILKAQLPETQFIMCTSLEDTETIFKALQVGATGYITKATPSHKILDALTDAHNGGSPMSSQIARKVITHFQQAPKPNTELDKLSQREQEILQYLAKGYRYKEIADMMHISIETVRKHIHNIYEKLQVSSRTDALNKVFPRG